jgi:ATP-dependent helicase HrpB
MLEPLPIDRHLPKISESLEKVPSLVLTASPGSGKTTRVPPSLLARSNPSRGEILVLEPRKVAAKYAARRVAAEMGVELGKEVGYQFRFENVTSASTRLRFLTEGMLMRRLLGDPQLKGVSTVLIDEFHERHLHGDIALAYLKRLQTSTRPELEIIVMSATLDSEAVSKFLGHCPIIQIDAPVFPVRVEYLKSAPAKHLDQLIKDELTRILSEKSQENSGDILVFLPGMADIRRASEALAALASRHGMLITPLHGELSREQQDLAIEKSKSRKIILSTNLAETSLTIEGVTVVIDSGLHRQASYSWWSGIPMLRTRPISRASAIQRAGRAGRTAPGVCYRLFTRGDFDSRTAFDTPEVQRADLTQTLLELKTLKVENFNDFPWFEAPAAQSIAGSASLLELLGAIQKNELTEIGRRMSQIPAHPRIARMMVEAERLHGKLDDTAQLAAMISEGDIGTELDAMAEFSKVLQQRAHQTHAKLISQFTSHLKQTPGATRDTKKNHLAVLAGFPDRVAKKRDSGNRIQTEVELLLATGGSAKAPNENVFSESDYFVILDIQEKQAHGQSKSQLFLRSLIAIDPDWLIDLSEGLLTANDEVIWDPQRKRVQAVSQMKYGQLVLSESVNADIPQSEAALAEAAHILLKSGVGIDLAAALDLDSRMKSLAPLTEIDAFELNWARLEIFRQQQAKTQLSVEDLNRFLSSLTRGKVSLSELRETDWNSELIFYFEPEQARAFESLVPTHFELPNKRRAKIQYKLAQAPWIESRLQDFFGVKTPPSIANGKIKLTLHLLAPNYRALQVTTDLPGFWARTYPEVRKELSRRYPRHTWPEDPLVAEPVAMPTKRPPKN